MGFFQDHSRFLRTLLVLLALYVIYGHYTGYDWDALAIGFVLLGVVAFLLVAYRYQDDFAPESEQ